MLATTKMKKTTTWATRCRCALARSSGRMRSIEAPVVPKTFASTAPTARNALLTPAEPRSVPRRRIPPEIVKRLARRMRKEAYSSTVCSSSRGAFSRKKDATGTPNARHTFA